jgi:ATP-dependent DNA ligase
MRQNVALSMVQHVARSSKPHPRFIEPMECKRVPKLPEGDVWIYEPKQDGYRIIAIIDGSSAQLFSMSGLSISEGQNDTPKNSVEPALGGCIAL